MADTDPFSTSTPARLGRQSRGAQEGLEFIQERIGLYAKVCFAISAAFYGAGWFLHFSYITEAAERSEHVVVDRLHALGTLVFLGTWLIARRKGTLSFAQLTALDAGTVALSATAFSTMAYMTGDLSGIYTALLAMICIVVMRAVLVPSEARRTLWISTLAMASLPAIAWLLVSRRPVMGYGQVVDGVSESQQIGFVVGQGLWAAACVTLATVASRIIYGLHEEVRKARQLGQYTLEQRLGQGGMGTVYRAKHAMLRRPTAVKLLRSEHVGAQQLQRFEREVQLTAGLSHPNTISIYDYGRTPEGIFYYAMEYLDGYNLDDLVHVDGPLPPGRVIHLLRQACGALQEAHLAGLIHRDVKPANIIVCERGGYADFVKVLDFGLVKDVVHADAGDPTLSSDAVITGTPLYLSPEAITSPHEMDARSDIYALGCVGYYLLSGHNVFESRSVVEICGHHLHTPAVPPSQRLGKPLPEDLEGIILSCLAKAPGERPESARELATRLSACADAAAWDEAAARRWWQARERDRANGSSDPAPGPTKTIDVDLAAREA